MSRIAVYQLNPEIKRIIVQTMTLEGPAETGLRIGDVILELYKLGTIIKRHIGHCHDRSRNRRYGFSGSQGGPASIGH